MNELDDIHSCSYYCDRPACIKAQRDELRDELASLKARIFEGIVLDVDDLALGHAGLPSEWRGKRVRLVMEE